MTIRGRTWAILKQLDEGYILDYDGYSDRNIYTPLTTTGLDPFGE